ncbi:MAG: 4Fe-4S dicluster domain-containing protein [Thermoplasmatales archaeon]|nr:MAG: 4Fe-4S dicluster domain-containing protein [Thermoplasmatales archaeon]
MSEDKKMITIYIIGKKYLVPYGLTIMKAMEYAGYRYIRGCGCRGGFCGGCGTVYRFKGDFKLQSGLACQTVAEDNMYLVQIPFFPANKTNYNMDELKPVGGTLLKLYPELARCVSCNTCTKVCPQDIEVMDYMQAALRGDVTSAADISFDCIMCGLCAVRCPAEIVQYNIAILCRRLYGKHIAPKAEHIKVRIGEISDGKFDKELKNLMKSGIKTLKKLYNERDIEPEESER